MPERDDVFVHIGLTKAASSTLQKFFTEYEPLFFVNRYETVKVLALSNGFAYDASRARSFISEHRAAIVREGKVPVFSHERLAGNPHSGHYDARVIADRIHEAVPDARILLCIREQLAMLASCYKQYVRIGGVRTLSDYLLPVWDFRVPLFDWTFYEYHRLIRYYFDLFGEQRVRVLLVEELESDPRAFYHDLSRFMGVPNPDHRRFAEVVNPGIADDDIEPTRIGNHFRSDRASVRDPGLLETDGERRLLQWYVKAKLGVDKLRRAGARRDIKAEVRELFAGKFAQSNAVTGTLIGKQLAALGYEVEA